MTPQEAYDKVKELGKRIPELELEPAISKDAKYSYYYAFFVIKGRFILGEPAISKNAQYSYWYALDIIEGKLPDFMHNQMILSNDESAKHYVNFIK